MTEKEIRERFTGCLVGLAVGDALGGPIEFMPHEEITKTFGVLKEMVGGGWLKLKPGEYTDDTTMMLCILESLVEKKGYDSDDIAQRFIQWLKSNPKDIGNTTRAALERIAHGISWREAGDVTRPSNGSVMRCAPIGLVYAFNVPELVKVSIETSAITHAHEDATTSCVLINVMISGLIRGLEKYEAFENALLVVKRINDSFFWECGRRALVATPDSGLAIDTAFLAIECFLSEDTFEEAVIKAVNLGGDADTIGAVTGALAGAYWGASAIPERWISKLNLYSAEKIIELANNLFDLVTK